jgi:hypothetical protein
MQVIWHKCGDDGHWCSLEHLDMGSMGEVCGVYMIWHEGHPGRVVRLGQGCPIKERLSAHRNDLAILWYARIGKLRVTWAYVPSAQRDGVEKYLANTWPPLIGDAFPDVEPIPVNSPW